MVDKKTIRCGHVYDGYPTLRCNVDFGGIKITCAGYGVFDPFSRRRTKGICRTSRREAWTD